MKYKKYNLKVNLKDLNSGQKRVFEYVYLAKYYKSRPKLLKELVEGLENIKNSNAEYCNIRYRITLSKCIGTCEL